MTPELQAYFDAYFEMFGSEGWKRFTEDLEDTLSSTTLITEIQAARTERDLGMLQGEISKTAAMITLPAEMHAAYGVAQEDEADVAD